MAPTYSNHGLFRPRASNHALVPATAPELTSPNNLPNYKALNLIVVPQAFRHVWFEAVADPLTILDFRFWIFD
jgi:hypothetical protein